MGTGPHHGAIATPIYQTSTYVQAAPGDHKGLRVQPHFSNAYRAAERLGRAGERTHGLCFATGMASIDAICKLSSRG